TGLIPVSPHRQGNRLRGRRDLCRCPAVRFRRLRAFWFDEDRVAFDLVGETKRGEQHRQHIHQWEAIDLDRYGHFGVDIGKLDFRTREVQPLVWKLDRFQGLPQRLARDVERDENRETRIWGSQASSSTGGLSLNRCPSQLKWHLADRFLEVEP